MQRRRCSTSEGCCTHGGARWYSIGRRCAAGSCKRAVLIGCGIADGVELWRLCQHKICGIANGIASIWLCWRLMGIIRMVWGQHKICGVTGMISATLVEWSPLLGSWSANIGAGLRSPSLKGEVAMRSSCVAMIRRWLDDFPILRLSLSGKRLLVTATAGIGGCDCVKEATVSRCRCAGQPLASLLFLSITVSLPFTFCQATQTTW